MVCTCKQQVGIAIVLVDTFIACFSPTKDILYDVENVFHFAPNAGFSLFNLFFVCPGQIVAIVPLRSSSLAIDLILSIDFVVRRRLVYSISVKFCCFFIWNTPLFYYIVNSLWAVELLSVYFRGAGTAKAVAERVLYDFFSILYFFLVGPGHCLVPTFYG